MSTIADLPSQAKLLTNPNGNGGWEGRQSTTERSEIFTWSCPWEYSNAFYSACIGRPQKFGVGGGATITRATPLQHPYNPRLWANELNWRGVGADANISFTRPWTHIIAQVGFGYLGYPVVQGDGATSSDSQDPPFIKVTAKTSSRVITVPGKFYTLSGGSTLTQNLGLIVGGASYVVDLYQVPSIGYFETIAIPLRSKVNSVDLVIGARTLTAGTVLFESYSYEFSRSLLGDAQWTCSLTLNVSNLPWNKAIGSNGVAQTLSPAPYSTADLTPLLM